MNAAYAQALEALELVAETPEVRGGVFVLDQQDMAFVRKAAEALRIAIKALPPCEYCDGTGDVHGLDGEWRGICTCPAGDKFRTTAIVPGAAS